MKYLLFLSLSIRVLLLTAQSSDSDSRFKVGVTVQPNFGYRLLLNDDKVNNNLDWLINARNDRELAEFGYTFGTNVEIDISERFFVETGINYSRRGYDSKKLEISIVSPTDPFFEELTSIKSKYGYHYAEVPVMINYKIPKGQFSFLFSAGVSAGILLKSEVITSFFREDGTDKKRVDITSDFEPFNSFGNLGVGGEYRFNRSTICVQPVASFGLLKITNTPITERLWNTGLQVGYYFKL